MSTSIRPLDIPLPSDQNLYAASADGINNFHGNLKAEGATGGTQTPPAGPKKEDNETPVLAKPSGTAFEPLVNLTPPSFGASLLSLITTMSAEQRQMTREQKIQQTEAQVANIEEQAKTMKSKAITQLCLGIVTGAVSIAQGVTAAAMTGKGINEITAKYGAGKTADGTTLTRNNAEMLLNSKVQAASGSFGGVSNMMNSITQAVGGLYDSEITELQANQERMKAMQESLDSLEQSLKETIQKALQTQNAIQENMNQTRTKILG